MLISSFYSQPGPSGIPSPAFGAGPGPFCSPLGPTGASNPLPSGIQSPAFGAGPVAMAVPTTTTVPSSKHATIAMVFLFIYITMISFRGFFFLNTFLEFYRIFGNFSKKDTLVDSLLSDNWFILGEENGMFQWRKS
jgi:hypothetical protein